MLVSNDSKLTCWVHKHCHCKAAAWLVQYWHGCAYLAGVMLPSWQALVPAAVLLLQGPLLMHLLGSACIPLAATRVQAARTAACSCLEGRNLLV